MHKLKIADISPKNCENEQIETMVFSFKQRLRQLGVTRLPHVEFKVVLAKGGQLYESEFLNQATKASGGQTTSPYPEELTMTMMTQPPLEDKAGLEG